MAILKVESWEDRSGEPEPGAHSFGFVYFSDGSRVGYSSQDPGTSVQVWQPRTNGGGKYQEVTAKHLDMALEALKEVGVIPS